MKNYLNENLLHNKKRSVKGKIVDIEGEQFYKIENFNRIPPFLFTIVSNSDHWMYISSNGGITCGRKNPENALFPYYTDDKIHDAHFTTGPKTYILVTKENKSFLWLPFEKEHAGIYNTVQNIYKSLNGDKIIFEEINADLQSSFSYKWMNSEKYGFVRESSLINFSEDKAVRYRIIDGFRNVMPYGVGLMLQNAMSTLVDGYKRSEIIEGFDGALFYLNSAVTDKAVPSEVLRSNIVWQSGLKNPRITLEDINLSEISNLKYKTQSKGKRGCFFLDARITLNPQRKKNWLIIADVGRSHSQIIELLNDIKFKNILKRVYLDISSGTEEIRKLVSSSDGLQSTADILNSSRHYSNTLFNIMRGGIFANEYSVSVNDFKNFVNHHNHQVFKRNNNFFNSLNDYESYQVLLSKSFASGDADLERITYEYLPLKFSRRHGDPSRPWNKFDITIKKEDGSKNLDYQGNWRDIFQNWEALALSFPEYIESFIVKFLNASTLDGYNPYRVTRNGFEWEVPEPDNPWSNIGYWGDHQIVYLFRLMKLSDKYHPGKLRELLTRKIFVFANVPYKIKGFDDLVNNPFDSIIYNQGAEKIISSGIEKTGADGKLYVNAKGEIYRVNLTEKLLIPLLAKLTNFVPGGGIWMNTQRPEWNDANNALAGYGLSMVTLCHLRKYVDFLDELFAGSNLRTVLISSETYKLLDEVFEILYMNISLLSMEMSDLQRLVIVEGLGRAGENYRKNIYDGPEEKDLSLDFKLLRNFFKTVLSYINYSINSSFRNDGLFHSYNLVHFSENGCTVENLQLMLEGQVALLSSGFLNTEKSVELLKNLKKSPLYREDQKSYMLYPYADPPGFLNKNIVDAGKVNEIPFLFNELKAGRRNIIEMDIDGNYHFSGDLSNVKELRKMLTNEGVSINVTDKICELFTETFNHKKFTGRSGSFFKYEGLGCIYWHMAAKLLLSVEELFTEFSEKNTDQKLLEKLRNHYLDIKEGLGAHKLPAEYGAFPLDPYSHSPLFAGAQQPGMTGQVKEDIICRYGELGVIVKNGTITFNPQLLNKNEFHFSPSRFYYYRNGVIKNEVLPSGSLMFTLCGIPVMYILSTKNRCTIYLEYDKVFYTESNALPAGISNKIFNHEKGILKIVVELNNN